MTVWNEYDIISNMDMAVGMICMQIIVAPIDAIMEYVCIRRGGGIYIT